MTFLSKVQIGNMALGHVAVGKQIESFTEDSQEALSIRQWYDISRLSMLEMYDWTFARREAELAELDDAASDEYQFRYIYPTDCLKVRRLVPKGYAPVYRYYNDYCYEHTGEYPEAWPYSVKLDSTGNQKTICTDVPNAVIRYTADVDNTSLYSFKFCEALSYLLAANIAYRLTGKLQTKQLMMQAAQQMLMMAARDDANEGVDKPPREAEWISRRT